MDIVEALKSLPTETPFAKSQDSVLTYSFATDFFGIWMFGGANYVIQLIDLYFSNFWVGFQ